MAAPLALLDLATAASRSLGMAVCGTAFEGPHEALERLLGPGLGGCRTHLGRLEPDEAGFKPDKACLKPYKHPCTLREKLADGRDLAVVLSDASFQLAGHLSY